MVAISSQGENNNDEIHLKELEVEEARSNEEPERDEESISNLMEEISVREHISPFLNLSTIVRNDDECKALQDIFNYPIKIYKAPDNPSMPFQYSVLRLRD